MNNEERLAELFKRDGERRLPIDVSALLAIQAAIDQIADGSGHGSVTIDIVQNRFSKITSASSFLFPQEKKRA